MSVILHQNRTIFINNEWSGNDDEQIESINPATEAIIARLASGNQYDVDKAVKAARTAFESGPYSKMNGNERAELLRKIAKAISNKIDELSTLETKDCGKPFEESKFDMEDAIHCFEYYAELAEDLEKNREQVVKVPDTKFHSITRKEPVGVVGAIIPWNFPLLMLAWKVAPAIAAGCTIVLKPSELTSLTTLAFADIVVECGVPPGVFNIVTGLGQTAGAALVAHASVDKVAFTGSVATGSTIMKSCATQVKLVTLELGGKSPIIVFDDADVENVVEWLMVGVFFNQGEVCSATSRLLIHENIADRVLSRLKEEAEKLKIGDPLKNETKLGAIVSATQMKKVLNYIDAGVKSGAKLLTGGNRLDCKGYFVEPTVLTEVPLDASVWREEIFGPVLCVRTFSSEAEAVKLANDTTFGLAGAVMSNDMARANRVARLLRAGIIWVNCSQPTFCEAPWGGYKRSGIGRELGPWGLNNYLHVKQITTWDQSEPWAYYITPKL